MSDILRDRSVPIQERLGLIRIEYAAFLENCRIPNEVLREAVAGEPDALAILAEHDSEQDEIEALYTDLLAEADNEAV